MSQQKKPLFKKILKYLAIGTVRTLALLGVVAVFFKIYIAIVGNHTGHTKQIKSRYHLIKLDQAIAEYRLDTGYYPVALMDLAIDSEDPMWMGPYVKEKELTDPWGKKYHYQFFQHVGGYQLYTLGSDHSVGGSEQKQDQVSKGSLLSNQINTLSHAKKHHIHNQDL
ncbi:type II secretion system protein GspG [Marinicella rhabdoformis]|uniref:type II secretion system protein GspG n=1 Tax=Marinicella rhabdoformis TaxID=2580566 RepID=UPI0012AEBB0D|nr:type II secretion system protein GspG [Marinicella rhabdoformis]